MKSHSVTHLYCSFYDSLSESRSTPKGYSNALSIVYLTLKLRLTFKQSVKPLAQKISAAIAMYGGCFPTGNAMLAWVVIPASGLAALVSQRKWLRDIRWTGVVLVDN